MRPLAIVLILQCLAFGSSAQNSSTKTDGSKSPDPPYLNQVFAWNGDSLRSLEQNEAKVKNKPRGFGGAETFYNMDGDKSTVRIKAGDSLSFAVKMAASMTDPSMLIKLYRFEPKKGSREAVINSSSGPYSKKGVSSGDLPYLVKQSANGVYLLVPSSKLSPGEYGFMNMMMMNHAGSPKMSVTAFAFGVD